MFQFIRNWLDQRILQRSTITSAQWAQAFGSLPLLDNLTADEKLRLQELAILFLHHKVFEGAHGLVVTWAMVEVMQPKPTDIVADPACGIGGFLSAT